MKFQVLFGKISFLNKKHLSPLSEYMVSGIRTGHGFRIFHICQHAKMYLHRILFML